MPPNRKSKRSATSLQLPRTTRDLIRKEATALSLTVAEYTALVSQLAQAIRSSILPEGTKDPALLRTLLDNPLLLSLAAAMAGSVWTALKDQMTSADSGAETAEESEGTRTPAQTPLANRPLVQPYGYPQNDGMPQRPIAPRPAAPRPAYPGQAYPQPSYPGQQYPGQLYSQQPYPQQPYRQQPYPRQDDPGPSSHPLPDRRPAIPGPPAQGFPPSHDPRGATRSPLAPIAGGPGPSPPFARRRPVTARPQPHV